MAAVAAHGAARCAFRRRDTGRRQRAAAPLPAASPPAVLEGSGHVPAGALRARSRCRAPALRLHAVCGRSAPLHRRNLRALRDADAPASHRAAFPPRPRTRQADRARGADQSPHPLPPAHEAGTPLMPNTTTNATTLAELLEANRKHGGKLTYLEGEHDAHDVSYEELHTRALGILHHLQRLGARRGDKLILFLGSNEQFIDAFWAAMLGGIVPVPVALGISDEHRHKLLRIARKLGKPFIYTERRSLDRIGAFASAAGESEAFAGLRSRAFLVDDLDDISRAGQTHQARPDDVAFIQFSSGSTSEPKGVVLTHGNIVANCRGVIEAAHFSREDISLSWMPLTHDMGLIGFHLIMFYGRIHAHLMPTELFIRRPLLWLALASRIRASILCSPNFGYKHYLKVLGERPIEGLDLSSVKLIFNGAEPISVELCEEFLTRLEPAGLARNAMYPVYGLAEASLAVSFPPPGAPMRTIALNRHRLGVGSPVELIDKSSRDAVQLISE